MERTWREILADTAKARKEPSRPMENTVRTQQRQEEHGKNPSGTYRRREGNQTEHKENPADKGEHGEWNRNIGSPICFN